jgi:hypothetical protein
MGAPTWPPNPQRSGCPGKAGAPLGTFGMGDGFVPVTRASELSPGAMKWVVIDRERVLKRTPCT